MLTRSLIAISFLLSLCLGCASVTLKESSPRSPDTSTEPAPALHSASMVARYSADIVPLSIGRTHH